jgi:hypothetical protein
MTLFSKTITQMHLPVCAYASRVMAHSSILA